MRAETSFFQAFWRSTFAHPLSSISTTLVLALVAYLSFFAATVPGEPLDRMGQKLMAWTVPSEGGKVQQGGFSLPFLSGAADGTLFGIFRRNLVVTDSDLTSDRKEGGEKRNAAPARPRSALRQARPHRPQRRRSDRR